MQVYPIYDDGLTLDKTGEPFPMKAEHYDTWRDENDIVELPDGTCTVSRIKALFSVPVLHVVSAPIGGGWALYAVVR